MNTYKIFPQRILHHYHITIISSPPAEHTTPILSLQKHHPALQTLQPKPLPFLDIQDWASGVHIYRFNYSEAIWIRSSVAPCFRKFIHVLLKLPANANTSFLIVRCPITTDTPNTSSNPDIQADKQSPDSITARKPHP